MCASDRVFSVLAYLICCNCQIASLVIVVLAIQNGKCSWGSVDVIYPKFFLALILINAALEVLWIYFTIKRRRYGDGHWILFYNIVMQLNCLIYGALLLGTSYLGCGNEQKPWILLATILTWTACLTHSIVLINKVLCEILMEPKKPKKTITTKKVSYKDIET